MNELIENKIEELYSLLMDKPNQVLAIFNDFFGENRVDMQGFMSIDIFKAWFKENPISEYVSRDLIGVSTGVYSTCRGKSLFDLEEEMINRILDHLCDKYVVDNIGYNRFNLGFILVHFPHVRVTNEYGRFVDINHLYAKVMISHKGLMEGHFTLNRAEYSYLHIRSDYMHSHIRHIPVEDFTIFQDPCLGSGPIKDTTLSLNREFDPDIWRLFCLELSKYVEVESISGVPYHRLEILGVAGAHCLGSTFKVVNNVSFYSSDVKNLIGDFTSYFIKQGKLKFNYANGSYSIGMSFVEYILTISNEFIDWYNKKFNNGEVKQTFERIKRDSILCECIIVGDKIYNVYPNEDVNRYANYNGMGMCTFKGVDVPINITDLNTIDEINMSIILNINISLYILSKILRVINYRYGKSEQRDQEGNRISEKIRYF